MKRIVRLTESDLTRIVRRVINEGENKKLETKFLIYRGNATPPEASFWANLSKDIDTGKWSVSQFGIKDPNKKLTYSSDGIKWSGDWDAATYFDNLMYTGPGKLPKTAFQDLQRQVQELTGKQINFRDFGGSDWNDLGPNSWHNGYSNGQFASVDDFYGDKLELRNRLMLIMKNKFVRDRIINAGDKALNVRKFFNPETGQPVRGEAIFAGVGSGDLILKLDAKGKIDESSKISFMRKMFNGDYSEKENYFMDTTQSVINSIFPGISA